MQASSWCGAVSVKGSFLPGVLDFCKGYPLQKGFNCWTKPTMSVISGSSTGLYRWLIITVVIPAKMLFQTVEVGDSEPLHQDNCMQRMERHHKYFQEHKVLLKQSEILQAEKSTRSNVLHTHKPPVKTILQKILKLDTGFWKHSCFNFVACSSHTTTSRRIRVTSNSRDPHDPKTSF